MSTKAKRLWRIAAYVVGTVILAAVCVFAGIRMERERQETLESQKEYVSAIAVVNMDNGVAVGNTQVNYAGQLLSFPNDHFSVTGLTDARAGIENGRYAAYIVIPETFSASVTSVENDPAKVVLSYQYNTKLGAEAKLQAVSDVNAFMALFNSNIAYMYMDAIMAEFHRVQDDSSIILANDDMELELIADIDAEDLIAAAVPVEELQAPEDIQPVELSAYSAQNSACLNEMFSGYGAAVQKGKDDLAAIKEEGAGVSAASEKFFGMYDTVLRETAEGQDLSLAEGREKLVEAVGLHGEGVDLREAELREMAARLINLQLEADRETANAQLQEIVEEIGADLSGNDPGGDEPPADGGESGKGGNVRNAAGGQEEESGQDGGGTGDEKKAYEIVLNATGDEEAINGVVKESLDLFRLEAESEEIDRVIQDYFVDALSEESRRQMTRLSEEMETVKGNMAGYEERLAEFDPMQYIEGANLNTHLNDIDGNAGEMLQAVEQNNADYMLYATEMYSDATEHTAQVRTSLDEANAQTVRNVVDCMNDLALSREEVNSQNVDLLKRFTESLTYARVGSQANVEVYDQIINPVVPRISGEKAADTGVEATAQRGYSAKTWLAAVLGAAILLSLAGIAVNLRRQYGRQAKEDEEMI